MSEDNDLTRISLFFHKKKTSTKDALLGLGRHFLPIQVGFEIRVVAGRIRKNVFSKTIGPGAAVAGWKVNRVTVDRIFVSLDPKDAIGEVVGDLVFDVLVLLPGFVVRIANVVARLAHDAAELTEALNLLDFLLDQVGYNLIVFV